MNDNIDNMMESKRPQLSAEERVSMFAEIEAKLAQPVLSPYFAFINSRVMTTLIIALILTLGASGTVLASESAKPGDFLFPVERVREEVQLALVSEERAAELHAQFATERLEELREILTEENDSDDDSKRRISENGEVRVGSAVAVLLNYIDRVEDQNGKQSFLHELKAELDNLEVAGRNSKDKKVWLDDTRLEVKDDRIEIRDGDTRVRIDDDGEVRVRKEDDTDEDVHQSSSDDESFDDSDSYLDEDDGDSSRDEFEDDHEESDDFDDEEYEDDEEEEDGEDDSEDDEDHDDEDREDESDDD